MPEDDLRARLARLKEQWDVAERRIKKAEQVRGGEIVSSAIFELRYAGRKLIDAIHLVHNENWENDPEVARKIHEFLDDATEDCVKAKHDAIDSMMDFITFWFTTQQEELGLKQLQIFFPNFLEIRLLIRNIQQKIEDSRANRTLLRDNLYNDIEANDYDAILSLYDRMYLSADLVAAEIRKERRDHFFLWAATIFFGVAGLVALYLTLWPPAAH